MAAQHKVAVSVSESFVGREIKVLVEGEANAKQLESANVGSWEHGLLRERESRHLSPVTRHCLVGRGEADAPDIDGRVFIRVPQGGMLIGEFAKVKIVGHTDYDLIAKPA